MFEFDPVNNPESCAGPPGPHWIDFRVTFKLRRKEMTLERRIYFREPVVPYDATPPDDIPVGGCYMDGVMRCAFMMGALIVRDHPRATVPKSSRIEPIGWSPSITATIRATQH